MTVSDSLIITSPQKRRHTIVYRDVLDLETEAKADLQKLGGWDFPIKTGTSYLDTNPDKNSRLTNRSNRGTATRQDESRH